MRNKKWLMILFLFPCCIYATINAGMQKSDYQKLKDLYEVYVGRQSDINEHLPILKKLAAECPRVMEIGVRSMTSTWALLQGLSENPYENREYVGIDIEYPPIESVYLADSLAKANAIGYHFIKGNDMHLESQPTDMLFIDSLHTYCHLTYELEKFSSNVRKYIVLHDTSEPWGDCDDILYYGDYSEYPQEIDRTKRGLWPAVQDFLVRHPEWELYERRQNNHGLTVLRRLNK